MAQRGNPRLRHLARLREALRTDRVLSASQVQRYFGLDITELHPSQGWLVFELMLQPIYGSVRSRQIIRFVTREPRLPRVLSPEQVGHLAGVAECRLARGFEPGDWSSAAQALGKGRQPDAVLTLAGHQVAIEYDTGSYSGRVVQQKVAAFAEQYTALIWVLTSQTRHTHFRDSLGLLGVELMLVNWWA